MSAFRIFGQAGFAAFAGLLVVSVSAFAQAPNGQSQQGYGQAQTQTQPQQQNQPQATGAAQITPRTIEKLTQQETDRLAQMGGQRVSQPVRPFAELSPRDQKYVEDILDYWQQESDTIKLYQCDFRRLMYDNGVVNYRDPKTGELAAASVALGKIRYAHPGNASYETTNIGKFVGPGKDYEPVNNEKLKEKWITDGNGIYEFDYEAKRLYETILPQHMRGAGAVQNSPIPFLFGANKREILNRYWVRVITPKTAQNQYWLEAWPKKAEDAQNYQKIEIVLSSQPMLPVAIHMYLPGYNPAQNNYSSVKIMFSKGDANATLSVVKNWMGNFVKPRTPLGWKKVPRQAMTGGSVGASPDIKR